MSWVLWVVPRKLINTYSELPILTLPQDTGDYIRALDTCTCHDCYICKLTAPFMWLHAKGPRSWNTSGDLWDCGVLLANWPTRCLKLLSYVLGRQHFRWHSTISSRH